MLLKRQLRRLHLTEESPPDAETWRAFLALVRRTYDEATRDRYTIERSLMVLSQEMQELNVELRRSEANFKVLVERSPDAIFVQDERAIRYANPAMARLLGYDDPRALVGLSSLETFIHPDDRAEVLEQRRRGAEQGDSQVRVRWLRRDGGVLVVQEVSASISFDDEPARLTIARDVTERLRLEEQLRQAQKMESIGRLAGGIAHDFNNVLAAILSYGHFCINETTPDDPMRQDLQEIVNAGRRAAELTKHLLAFSRKQVLQPQVFVLNALVTDVHKMLRHVIGEHVQVVARLEPSLWAVSADPGQITQVLMNLALNARDAMPGGGQLTIETRNARLGQTEAAKLGLLAGEYVEVVTTDTGTGIAEDAMPHLFEPFFTTKEHGKGTGLGLATSFGIARQSSGALIAQSEPGQGAAFTLYLPRTELALEAGATRVRSMVPTRGVGCVLVVEDDAAVREVVRRMLVARGFDVVVVRDMPEALGALERVGPSVRFVMTDLVIPGGDGFALARRARERAPNLPFLFMSGYSEYAGTLDPDALFLPKPFTPAQLDEALSALLGESATWRISSASPDRKGGLSHFPR